MRVQLGEWELVKKLGEGNFGYTYMARHVLLKDNFLACIKVEKVGSPESIDAFRTEAAAYSGLRHPHLPTLLGYHEGPDPRDASRIIRYMVLSYIKGQSLSNACHDKGFPSDEHICWIVDRLLDGLSYLNYNGILHLDIKPDNVLLNIEEHDATLVDLGMASIKPRAGAVARGGSPVYMAPEVMSGFTPGPESDLYSVGKVVCWLTRGDPSTGVFGTMNPTLQTFFEEWVLHDPRKRPRNPAALRHELADLRLKCFGRVGSETAWETR